MRTKEKLWDLLRRAQGIVRLERQLGELGTRVEHEGARAAQATERLESRVSALEGFLTNDVREIMRAVASEDAENRRRLWRARVERDYELAFTDPEPLVSVVIPTLDRPELLRTRSLPSVLGQTYEHLEVVVMGDCAGMEVEEAVASLEDPRLRFHNLTQRLPPTTDPLRHWYTASVMARNEGFRLARGSWLVSFDDDDLLYPESIARLLAAARERRAEVAYGRFRVLTRDGPRELGEFPPRLAHFTWQSGICHASLRFFERELFAAAFAMPNDAFLVEAMLRAGVRFAMIPDLVCDLYPSKEW